jgi:hypothetical protein
MHRFELGTCARLVYGASGVVRSDFEFKTAEWPMLNALATLDRWQRSIEALENYTLSGPTSIICPRCQKPLQESNPYPAP